MANRIRTGTLPPVNSLKSVPYKGQIIGCANAIILALGGLVTAGIGLGGYLQVGSLSQLSQMQSIIMMAAGGEGGALLLIVGITSEVKMCQRLSHIENTQVMPRENVRLPLKIKALRPDVVGVDAARPAFRTAVIPPLAKSKIYGREAGLWNVLNVKIADVVPEPPEMKWDDYDPYFKEPYRENYVLLYIPKKILVNGEVKDFNNEILQELCRNPNVDIPGNLKPYLETDGLSGWVLASTSFIPDSLGKNYKEVSREVSLVETQAKMIEAKGFRMAHVLEAAVLCLMVYHDEGKRLFGRLPDPPHHYREDPWLCTRCIETRPNRFEKDWAQPIRVGFESDGIKVSSTWQTGFLNEGVIAVREMCSYTNP